MASVLSSFEKLEGLDDFYVAENRNLRCAAIVLKDGGLCIFSPVFGLNEEARESLEKFGKVKFLLAPNHYHHKGLLQYLDVFGDAKLCASTAAIPRLSEITGQHFENLDMLKSELKSSMYLLEPEGLKTGETWVCRRKTGQTIWLVGDAFIGVQAENGSAFSEKPGLLKPFPKFGVGNKEIYLAWASRQIKTDMPDMLIPCHGSPVRCKDLPQRLERVVMEGL